MWRWGRWVRFCLLHEPTCRFCLSVRMRFCQIIGRSTVLKSSRKW